MGIKVFIVDDHSLVRTGLRLTLQQAGDIEVIGEAESGEEGLPQIRKLKRDVVLCDLHLPGISGLEVTERITRGDYGTRVIVVSVLEDGPMPRRLLEAGASGYVGKSISLDVQVELLRRYGNDKILFKPEASPIGPLLSQLRDRTQGQARVYEGSGGILLIDSFRRGIAGTMPGMEFLDAIVPLWRALVRS